jgi:sortase A
MNEANNLDDLSAEDLEQLLFLRRHDQRRQRLERIKAEGRLIEVKGLPPPEPVRIFGRSRPVLAGLAAAAGWANPAAGDGDEAPSGPKAIRWGWIGNKVLLLVEIAAVIGLIGMGAFLWIQSRALNREIATAQIVPDVTQSTPTPAATPVIGVVVLPSGHKPPVNGRPPEPGEAGEIPAHLLPIIDAYVPPPIPTPGPEQARRIQIPALGIDKPIVQGDSWEQLKKGVAQHLPSALPGQKGNIVLSAHNDIYGEIFRYLDRLTPGDEIIISTERQSYTYVVRDIEVVNPTDVAVMAQTRHESATLISCYPYLVNNKRIVVFADLADSRFLS